MESYSTCIFVSSYLNLFVRFIQIILQMGVCLFQCWTSDLGLGHEDMVDRHMCCFTFGAFTGGEAGSTLLLLYKLLPRMCIFLLGTLPRRELPRVHIYSVFKGNTKLCSKRVAPLTLPQCYPHPLQSSVSQSNLSYPGD